MAKSKMKKKLFLTLIILLTLVFLASYYKTEIGQVISRDSLQTDQTSILQDEQYLLSEDNPLFSPQLAQELNPDFIRQNGAILNGAAGGTGSTSPSNEQQKGWCRCPVEEGYWNVVQDDECAGSGLREQRACENKHCSVAVYSI